MLNLANQKGILWVGVRGFVYLFFIWKLKEIRLGIRFLKSKYLENSWLMDFYLLIFKNLSCQMLVAHACNSSYSEGTDQKDRGSKTASGK
jgi:hypothetical protein